ncbi:MAG: InlB B-repeat-containing protein [Lachnospiraceae bacterium]|nr:InlB B-repeat-containing protein [Lachnospiraceae bacterium]
MEVDNDDFFTVTAPAQSLLMPGDKGVFVLDLHTDLDPGSYSGTLTIVGSDAAGTQKTVGVTVTATVKQDGPHVDSVTISPSSLTLGKGGSAQLSATVRGSNLPTTDVDWAIRGAGDAGTTISQNGFLQIGAKEDSQSVMVMATAVADPSVGDSITVSIQPDTKTHYVTVKAGEGGSVSGGGTVKEGDSMTVYASPGAGYSFRGWYDQNDNYVSNKKTYTIENVTSDISLLAKFDRASVSVVTYASPAEGGATSGDGTYTVGGSATIKAAANKGYTFKGWKIGNDIVSKDSTFTLTNLNSDVQAYAVFDRNQFTVNVDVTPSNSGAVDGAGAYDPGKDVKLRAYASQGYVFKGWYSNYQLMSTSDTMAISKIDKDYCISAVFEKKGTKSYVMSSKAGAGGKITPAVSAAVPEGSSVNYAITPDPGYYIQDVKVDGKSVGALASYAFTNIQANHTIEASFAKKQAQKGTKTAEETTTGKTMDEARKDAAKASDADKKSAEDNAEAVKANTDLDEMQGILQEYDMTTEEAYLHINDDVGAQMFMDAYKQGYISLVMNNDYSYDNVVSKVNDSLLYQQRPAIKNMEETYDSIVTDTEAIGTLSGKKLELHIDVTDLTGMTSQDDMDKLVKLAKDENLAIDNFFDITILKTYDGVTSHVTDIGADAEFSLRAPDSLRKTGGQYKILHIHDGEAEILDDLSSDPNEIDFKANTFSTFAMAYVVNDAFSAGKITGDQGNAVYVDTLNQTTGAPGLSRASKIVVIVLIAVIVVALVIVAFLIGAQSKGGKKPGGKKPGGNTPKPEAS